ncbi:MAG: CBS domain-containing protein [Deltaproteobacteria bacterium]|nr:CBS domain-containing protein [Deltaproteobacteria bacterium]
MIVRNWMRKPISIAHDATLLEAAKRMKVNGSNWLPVVNGHNLVGTISVNDLKQAIVSEAPSLKIHDMLSVIPEIKVSARMDHNPEKVLEDRTIEEAADILLDKAIGGVSVVDGEGRLKGIIERQDILRVLISLSGLREKGLQVALKLVNRPGSVAEVEEIVRGYGCRILGMMSTFKEVERFRHVYLRLCKCDRTKLSEMTKDLQKLGKLLYVADLGENKTDFYGEYEPPMTERHIG